jgi:Na+-translocating ferredoxin:NAD+ oxidoreductase RnfC subunit
MRREGREQQLCFLKLHPAQEDEMTELEMKTEAEVEDFTDELSDEALDRAEGAFYSACCPSGISPVADR